MPGRAPGPGERAVVDEALSRGYLRPEQLREAIARQRELERTGRPAPLMELLARYLRPEQRGALAQVYRQACAPRAAGEACDASTLLVSPPAAGGAPGQGEPPDLAASPADPLAAARARAERAYREVSRLDPHFAPHAAAALERLETLGEGGMGVVYRVRDRRLGRQAALKLIRPERAAAGVIQRFRREAEITAGLDHPSIPPVYEAGTDAGGQHFLLMRVIEGQPLSERIVELHGTSPLAGAPARRRERELLDALVRVGEAVAYAHSQGVVHRDLKPHNVMVGRFGEVMVVDWGLARGPGAAGGDDDLLRGIAAGGAPGAASPPDRADLTEAGAVLGTPGYMAPEQAEGGPVDARADVFALGAILTCVLTGRPPVEGSTVINRLDATLRGRIALPRDRRPDVAPELHSIAARALARAASDRYPTAEAFVADLRAYLAGEEVAAHRYGLRERARRLAERHVTLLVGLSVGALALLGVGLALSVAARERAEAARTVAERDLAERGRAAALLREEETRRRARALTDGELLRALIAEADALWPASAAQVERGRDWLARAGALLEGLEGHRATLASRRAVADDPATAPEERTLARDEADRLGALVPALVALQGEGDAAPDPYRSTVPGLRARLELARQLRWRTVDSPEARAAWERARSEVAASGRYGALDLEPVEGLLPLGLDASSGLLELWHVQSGARPLRGARGRWEVAEESGMVLVLVPGGTFQMGSDEHMAIEKPAHAVTLRPFFIAKYEMTQGQWLRATGENPSEYRPEPGSVSVVSLANPVEQVSWDECRRVLGRLGLRLPSEAEWERGARAGTTTAWWTGDDPRALETAGNLADRTFGAVVEARDWHDWRDGYVVHGPVGRLSPNPFGLHDTIGNVWEWVQDSYQPAYVDAPQDGSAREVPGAVARVCRGACWGDLAPFARSAFRNFYPPAYRGNLIGVRAALSAGGERAGR